MTILVTGATGTVGRELVGQLARSGERVRALTRDPAGANLPAGVEVVRGDLTDAASLVPALAGVTGLHLITFGGDEPLGNGAEIVALATAARVRRVSVLSGWDPSSVEAALAAGDLPWTLLRPVEFMANALDLAESIRADGVVRTFDLGRPSAMVHEADIAAVAAVALTQDGHGGMTYALTGPQALTLEQKLATIGAAVGREVRFVPLTEEEFRRRLRDSYLPEEYIEFAVELEKNPPGVGMVVDPTVEKVTGRPARTFAQWVSEHADAFR
ncbi:NmrA family NAD(P)-binding protein [Nonomuraea sp. NN258]|nr:NmrA family NAD(P)-binding protein [Nonomuraea antri]